jgi:hypothetical protein
MWINQTMGNTSYTREQALVTTWLPDDWIWAPIDISTVLKNSKKWGFCEDPQFSEGFWKNWNRTFFDSEISQKIGTQGFFDKKFQFKI